MCFRLFLCGKRDGDTGEMENVSITATEKIAAIFSPHSRRPVALPVLIGRKASTNKASRLSSGLLHISGYISLGVTGAKKLRGRGLSTVSNELRQKEIARDSSPQDSSQKSLFASITDIFSSLTPAGN